MEFFKRKYAKIMVISVAIKTWKATPDSKMIHEFGLSYQVVGKQGTHSENFIIEAAQKLRDRNSHWRPAPYVHSITGIAENEDVVGGHLRIIVKDVATSGGSTLHWRHMQTSTTSLKDPIIVEPI